MPGGRGPRPEAAPGPLREPPGHPASRLRPKPNATPDDLAFGVNATEWAIETGAARSLFVWNQSQNPRVAALVARARDLGVPVESVDVLRLDQLTGDGVHQGVLARLRPLEPAGLTALIQPPGSALAVLLDQVTDPQNVGAVLRTAVAVGVRAVVIPKRRGAHLTPGVHRASAGLSFVAPVAAPQNLALALRDLKEAGYWAVAADAGPGSADATAFDWPQRTALVLGSEGEGVSQLLLRESDFRVRLPMDPRVESLNVGVAFGALAYLWRRQWPAPASPGGG
jgi:23S rRNA (guanosine2251-2'-O)-methyltransferase